jgi:predicted nucleic acid-binding protein
MDEALVDTDILSEVLKARNARVLEIADRYLAEYGHFAFSAITLYEILRGLRASRAVRALNEFLKLVDNSDVLPVSVPVLTRAAGLWADAGAGGHPRNDADLIVAATALETGRALVTGNAAHFAWIEGLPLADWRRIGS